MASKNRPDATLEVGFSLEKRDDDFSLEAVEGSCEIGYVLLFADLSLQVDLSVSEGTISYDSIVNVDNTLETVTFQGESVVDFSPSGLYQILEMKLAGTVTKVTGKNTYTSVSGSGLHVVYDGENKRIRTSDNSKIFGVCKVRYSARAKRYKVVLPPATALDLNLSKKRSVLVTAFAPSLAKIQSVELSFDCSVSTKDDFDKVGETATAKINITVWSSAFDGSAGAPSLKINFCAMPIPDVFFGAMSLQGGSDLFEIESPGYQFDYVTTDITVVELLEFSNTSLVTLSMIPNLGSLNIEQKTPFYNKNGGIFSPWFQMPNSYVGAEQGSSNANSSTKRLNALQIACVDVGNRLTPAQSGTIRATYTVKKRCGSVSKDISYESLVNTLKNGWDFKLKISYIKEAPGTFEKYLFSGEASIADPTSKNNPGRE